MIIGLMGALEEEVHLIAIGMAPGNIEQYVQRTFFRGYLSGHEVVVVHSGVGKVRAAACSQFLIEHFGVDRLIFTGVAGALNPELCVGDIVISGRTLEWDFQSGKSENCWHQADPNLVNLAVKAAVRLGLRARVGSVLTGDQPILEIAHSSRLWQTFNGDCVEMEGSAVAQVCSMNEVPFVLIRVISDLADESTLQELARSFAQVASLPAKVAIEMLKELH